MEELTLLTDLLPLIIPILLIDLFFKIYVIIDILKEDRIVKGGNKIVWIVVSMVINFGWVIYLIFGKDE
jgi:ACR3 family arsenite efflux pump ArsB